MIDHDAIGRLLASIGLEESASGIVATCRERVAPGIHGDQPRWQAVLDALPAAEPAAVLDADVVRVGSGLPDRGRQTLEALLLKLVPWRKGPFEVCGIVVDAEWRSDMKWRRLAGRIAPLDGRRVLDVGCGNGYYALRMLGAGAGSVIGIEPTLAHIAQFAAIGHYAPPLAAQVLPLRLDDLPAGLRAFDTTFSMGVLYHQRSPIDHLRQLRQTLKPGGELVLETLFLPGEASNASTPPDRYARMRNVWLLPTIAELSTWLERTGFDAIEVVDQSTTTVDEQRTTGWMPFESLDKALDPDRPGQTVEGWPAPRRVIVTAKAP